MFSIRRACALLVALACVSFMPAAFAEDAGCFFGVDVSELLAQEASGVKYHDAAGNETDALKALADAGVTHIRVRGWNDPFDADGHGYGGGNCDTSTAAVLGARAAQYGMKTLVDFHYSDFWADPARQIAPKAWQGMSLEDKTRALYDFTRESLLTILAAGADVDMVQVGNETNNGMAGEYDLAAMTALMAAGCRAVHDAADESGRDIRAAVHLTEPRNYERIQGILSALAAAGVEFDAVGLSYYPYWHDTLDNLRAVIADIRETYGKDVFVAETAWPFTLEQGDGSGDVVDYDPGLYPVSPEGQAQAVADVIRAASDVGALGVYYWGGIWTPVGSDAAANWPLWETFGSGWASRYASPYDPEHVGQDFGGCAWDNQALFDFDGHPLPLLERLGDILSGNFEFTEAAPVEEAPSGEEPRNFVSNPGFEDADRSMWETRSLVEDIPYDYQDFVNDAHGGTVAFHYWSEQDMHLMIQQTIDGLERGAYTASVFSQGGDMKDAALTLFVWADGVRYEASFMNTKWADWQHPVIEGIPVSAGQLTIGVEIRCGAKGWGTLDDFSLTRAE